MLFLALLCAATAMYAQSSASSRWMATAGLGMPILDNGLGLHLGLNFHENVGDRLALEGQAAYQYVSVNSGFLSGEGGQDHAAGAFVGGRLYFNDADQAHRWYLNALIGATYYAADTSTPEWITGATMGIYRAGPRWVFGLAAESPQLLMVKCGIRL